MVFGFLEFTVKLGKLILKRYFKNNCISLVMRSDVKEKILVRRYDLIEEF